MSIDRDETTQSISNQIHNKHIDEANLDELKTQFYCFLKHGSNDFDEIKSEIAFRGSYNVALTAYP